MSRSRLPRTALILSAGALAAAAYVRSQQARRQALAQLQRSSRVAQTACGPVEYADAGRGAPVLVVHGVLGGYDQGLVVAWPLASAGFRVLAVSRAGYLRTPLSTGHTLAEQADAYAALLDTLGVGSAAVIGISGGGPSSLQFALCHPGRCQSLTLMCAVTHASQSKPRSPLFQLLHQAMRSDLLMWLAAGGLMRALPGLMRRDPALRGSMAGRTEARLMYRAVLRSFFPVSARAEGIENDLAQIASLPALPLELIERPTLVLHGRADSLVPFAHAEYAAARIPGARLVALDGGDHGFFISHYDQVWPEIMGFLRAHAAQGVPA